MTAEGLFAILCRRGASVSVKGARLRVEAPRGVLRPGIREDLTTHKADLLRLVALVDEYRTLLRSDADDSCFLDVQTRLIDELGPDLAIAVCERAQDEQVGQDRSAHR